MTKTRVCNHAERTLCAARIFNCLPSDQVCQVRRLTTSISYPAHTLLCHIHAPAYLLYILKAGGVKLTTARANGGEQILCLVLPGQMFGFVFRDDSFYPHSARAVTDVSVGAVRHRDMTPIRENDPAVSLRMIRMLDGELERTQALIRDLGRKSSAESMASCMRLLMPLRGGRTSNFALPLTRRQIFRNSRFDHGDGAPRDDRVPARRNHPGLAWVDQATQCGEAVGTVRRGIRAC